MTDNPILTGWLILCAVTWAVLIVHLIISERRFKRKERKRK